MKFRVKNNSGTIVPKTAASADQTPLSATAMDEGNLNQTVFGESSASLDQDDFVFTASPGVDASAGPSFECHQQEIEPNFNGSRPAKSAESPMSLSALPLQHSTSAISLVSLQGFLRSIAERGRKYAGRQRWRLVLKDGTCNVSSMHVTERKRKYLVDLFTTVIEMKWRFNLLMFALAFVVSWTTFALIWWLIAFLNGDCQSPMSSSANVNSTQTPCVLNVYDFWSALLFSIESQHTIGYGVRVIQTTCLTAIVVLMLQSCIGVFIQCLITGIVFSKLSRPKSRSQTLMFSRHAVICRREGQHCLLFRVGDMRKSHIIGTSIRAIMVRDTLTSEGESIPLCQSPLRVETEMGGSDTFAFLVWPVTVAHIIDENSPLWDISADQLITEHFEIIVILEGTVESNGKLTQVRTSYLPSEILWGYHLTPLLTYQTTKGNYDIDYKQFNGTIPVAMMEHSAKTASTMSQQTNGTNSHKPFYQNMEKDSSISLFRSQRIGQPMELTPVRRLYKRFKSAPQGTVTDWQKTDQAHNATS